MPARAQGTIEPTARNFDWTATPKESVSGSKATMEKVATISLNAPSLVLGPGIQGLADAVAEEVEAEDREEDSHPGEERHPPGRGQVGLGLKEHRTPTRLPRLGPEPEVREGGLGDYRVAHRERRLDQERRQRVREDVMDHYPQVAGADGPRRLDVV